MEANVGDTVVIKAVVVGRHSDGGTEYVRVKGAGFTEYDPTALIPLAWVGEVKKGEPDDQGGNTG